MNRHVDASVHTPIGAVVQSVDSWSPAASEGEKSFRYIDLSSIDNERKELRNVQSILFVDAPSRARQLVRGGDILVSTVRPNLNGVAQVPADEAATASTGFCVLRPDPSRIDARYLFQWLRTPTFVSDMEIKATGASYPAVSDRIIKESPIPLPVLDEQRRIAAILDQADDLRCKRRATLEQLGLVDQNLLSEISSNLSECVRVSLGEICEVKGGKRLPEGAAYSISPTSYPYVRVSDMRLDGISVESIKFIDRTTHNAISRYVVRSDDIVISIAGSIGLISVVPKILDGANLTENAARITPKGRDRYDPIYLSRILKSAGVQSQIRSKTGQVTIGKLALFRIEQIELSLPSIQCQRAFAACIAEIDKLKASHRAHLAKLDALFAGLQHRAFRGEL